MKNIVLFFSVLTILGCASIEKKEGSDDLSIIPGTKAAVVEVSLGKDGMPSVDTDPVIVEEGQRVVWVGPSEMTIRFVGASPVGKKVLETRSAVVNVKVPRQDAWEKGEDYKKFKYDVIVNGVVLDPLFIVRRGI